MMPYSDLTPQKGHPVPAVVGLGFGSDRMMEKVHHFVEAVVDLASGSARMMQTIHYSVVAVAVVICFLQRDFHLQTGVGSVDRLLQIDLPLVAVDFAGARKCSQQVGLRAHQTNFQPLAVDCSPLARAVLRSMTAQERRTSAAAEMYSGGNQIHCRPVWSAAWKQIARRFVAVGL